MTSWVKAMVRGIASAFGVGERARPRHKSVSAALAGDWSRVGGDLTTVLQWESKRGRHADK